MCFSILWKARNTELFLLEYFQNKSPSVMENVALRREIFRKILSEWKKTENQVEVLFNENKNLGQ